MTLQATPKKKGGFDLPNFWINTYYLVMGKPIPTRFKTHHSNGAKIELNRYFLRFSKEFKIYDEDIRGLIYFRYLHNPLGKPLATYGAIWTLKRCCSSYFRWKRENIESVEKLGLMRAILATAPELDDVDMMLMSDVNEYVDSLEDYL